MSEPRNMQYAGHEIPDQVIEGWHVGQVVCTKGGSGPGVIFAFAVHRDPGDENVVYAYLYWVTEPGPQPDGKSLRWLVDELVLPEPAVVELTLF